MTSITIILKNGRSFYFEGQMPEGWKPRLLEMWQQKNGIWELRKENGHTLLVDVEDVAAIDAHDDGRETT